MNKRILALVLALTLALSLAACGGGDTVDAAAARRDANELVVGIAQDLETSLDPHKAVTAANREILFNVFEGLVKPDADGNLTPALAERWNISDDGLRYTFYLRTDATFHNGQTLTSDDVQYSLLRAKELGNIAGLENIESVMPGGDTVTILLTQPDSDFLSYLTAAIEPYGYEEQDTAPVGTGPFKFVSRAPQQNFVLERFDAYWGEGAKADKLTLQIYENAEALVLALKSGAVDVCAHLTATQASQLTEQFDILEGTMNLVQAIYLNHAYEPLANETVREALCYALDREQVFDIVADGHGTAVGSSMYPNFRKYFRAELANAYPHDVERAKALLASAGYADGFDLTITVPSNYQPHMDTAQVVAEQLRAVGVNVTIDAVEWTTWLNDAYIARDYQATVVGVDASTLTARAMLERFTSTAGNNFTNYANADYDAAFAAALAAPSDEEATEHFIRCEEILSETAANVYIQDLCDLVAVRKGITGYRFYPLYAIDLSTLTYT